MKKIKINKKRARLNRRDRTTAEENTVELEREEELADKIYTRGNGTRSRIGSKGISRRSGHLQSGETYRNDRERRKT